MADPVPMTNYQLEQHFLDPGPTPEQQAEIAERDERVSIISETLQAVEHTDYTSLGIPLGVRRHEQLVVAAPRRKDGRISRIAITKQEQKDLGLKNTDLRCLAAILRLRNLSLDNHTSPCEYSFAGKLKLTTEATVSWETLRKSLKLLSDLGLIRKGSRQGNHDTNRWYFDDKHYEEFRKNPYFFWRLRGLNCGFVGAKNLPQVSEGEPSVLIYKNESLVQVRSIESIHNTDTNNPYSFNSCNHSLIPIRGKSGVKKVGSDPVPELLKMLSDFASVQKELVEQVKALTAEVAFLRQNPPMAPPQPSVASFAPNPSVETPVAQNPAKTAPVTLRDPKRALIVLRKKLAEDGAKKLHNPEFVDAILGANPESIEAVAVRLAREAFDKELGDCLGAESVTSSQLLQLWFVLKERGGTPPLREHLPAWFASARKLFDARCFSKTTSCIRDVFMPTYRERVNTFLALETERERTLFLLRNHRDTKEEAAEKEESLNKHLGEAFDALLAESEKDSSHINPIRLKALHMAKLALDNASLPHLVAFFKQIGIPLSWEGRGQVYDFYRNVMETIHSRMGVNSSGDVDIGKQLREVMTSMGTNARRVFSGDYGMIDDFLERLRVRQIKPFGT